MDESIGTPGPFPEKNAPFLPEKHLQMFWYTHVYFL